MVYKEQQIRDETCRELLHVPGQTLTTSELIESLSKRLAPTGQDSRILLNRNDTHFSQKVRNIVSHRNQRTGLVARSIADYNKDEESWTLTETGCEYASSL